MLAREGRNLLRPFYRSNTTKNAAELSSLRANSLLRDPEAEEAGGGGGFGNRRFAGGIKRVGGAVRALVGVPDGTDGAPVAAEGGVTIEAA